MRFLNYNIYCISHIYRAILSMRTLIFKCAREKDKYLCKENGSESPSIIYKYKCFFYLDSISLNRNNPKYGKRKELKN